MTRNSLRRWGLHYAEVKTVRENTNFDWHTYEKEAMIKQCANWNNDYILWTNDGDIIFFSTECEGEAAFGLCDSAVVGGASCSFREPRECHPYSTLDNHTGSQTSLSRGLCQVSGCPRRPWICFRQLSLLSVSFLEAQSFKVKQETINKMSPNHHLWTLSFLFTHGLCAMGIYCGRSPAQQGFHFHQVTCT